MTKEIQNTGVENVPGPPGFEVFEKEGLHYFQFKDAAGVPVLFSQPYTSAEKRDQGMETLRRNAADAGHYAKTDASGQFFFAIKAGNHKELARSRAFQTATKRDKAMKEFQVAWAAKPMKPMRAEPAVSPDVMPSHYRFTLSFYPDKTSNVLRGRIEYPLVKEDKDSFDGLDMACIEQFIAQRLPQPGTHKEQPRQAVQGIAVSRSLEVLQNGLPAHGQRIDPEETIEVQLPLSAKEIQVLAGKGVKAHLFIKALEHSSDIISVQKEGPISEDHTIRVKAPAHDLAAGLYRFTLKAEFEDPGNKQEEATLEGSSLILVS